MRLIGHLESESLADRISRLLVAQGIRNLIEPDEGPRWALWVHSEEDLDRARQLFASFRANPDDPASRSSASARKAAATERPQPVSNTAQSSQGRNPVRVAPFLTIFLILVCSAVAAMTQLSETAHAVGTLQIAEVPFRWGMSWELFLPEIRRGEIWRLFTPALLHFSWPHLLFNLWAAWVLGQMVELNQGPVRLLVLLLMIGILSNLGQYLVSGPGFGGLSGVIYGLLGYVWMMGRYCPAAGMGLHPQTVVMMLAWFVICLTNTLGVPVANTAHGVGLVTGVLWGRIAAALNPSSTGPTVPPKNHCRGGSKG